MQMTTATVLVTGANRGIGRALTDELLAAGAKKIYATARSAEGLDALSAIDPRIVALKLDVADPQSVAAAAAAAPDVTLLINNAGVIDFGSFTETDANAIKRNFDTNFYGALNMSLAFAPLISSNGGGKIANFLTVVALASMPGLSVYNASKAAAWSMTQSLRASFAAQNVDVIGVFPGPVDTDMLAGVEMPKTSPADVARAVIAGIEAEEEDIFPDPMSENVYARWRTDHKAIEREFAAM